MIRPVHALLFLGALLGCSAVKLPVLGLPPLTQAVGGKERPLNTSFHDTYPELPAMDHMDFGEPTPLADAPRNPETGAFLLTPGVYYRGNLESFCLHAGAWAPVEGKGYLGAPMKGSRAAIIQKLLQRRAQHPELHQRDVQLLLWAILARTGIEDLKGRARHAAFTLLRPDEMLELNGGARGYLSEFALQQVLKRAPAPLRQVLRTENEMRRVLTQTDARFDEVEELAMATGMIPADPRAREIPTQRWTEHPDGFVVRLDMHGYSTTTHHVIRPLRWTSSTDTLGRITRVENNEGTVYEVEYDDNVLPKPIQGNPGWALYRVKRGILTTPDPDNTNKRLSATFYDFPDIVAPLLEQHSHQRKDIGSSSPPRLVKVLNRGLSDDNTDDAREHLKKGWKAVGNKKKERGWILRHIDKLMQWYSGASGELRGNGEYDTTGTITKPANVHRQQGGNANVPK